MNTNIHEVTNNFFVLMKKYLLKQISANSFEDKYIDLWNVYVDSENQSEIARNVSDSIGRVFTAIDVFNPDSKNRANYEIDENQLRKEVKMELLKIKPELEKELL
ncbi:MAG: hypothetical protein H7A32_00515 [Deltaproteobacteria bacterium]|nr:hypothetical protein [Deltaproteobacteria bacterium]